MYILLLTVGCTQTLPSQTPALARQSIESFDEVAAAVTRSTKAFGGQNVLVVLDIDNTILTSHTDLGSDVWYQWQTGKLDLQATADQRVDCLFEDAIGLLYELAPMRLTERSLPEHIRAWQDQGNVVFALTSRDPRYRAATERELNAVGIDLSRSPVAQQGNDSPIYRDRVERAWSYMQGIMMTTGMDKGDMLSLILKKTKANFDSIIFVDDTEKHIEAVSREFADRPLRELRLFHYQKIEAERVGKQGALLTDSQARHMADDWRKLQETLQEVFPAREQIGGCLDTGSAERPRGDVPGQP